MANVDLKLPPGATIVRPAAPKLAAPAPSALRLPPGAKVLRAASGPVAPIGDLPAKIVKPAIDQAAANDAAQKQVVLDGAFAKFPALAKYKDKFVYTEMPGPDKRGQLESYPPWEGRNPNPGKHTIEMYNADATPQQKSDLVAGDMLHYMGAVDPTTGKAIDPGFRALKEQFIKSMTPRQLGMAQQRFADEKAAGSYAPEVTFDQYLDMSHADEYLMGALTPDQGDYWRGRPGSHQKSVYSPEQDQILNQMRGYLAQGPDPEEEALKAQAKALPGALEQKAGFWENRLNDLKAGYLGMKSGMDINVGKNIRDIYRSRTKGFDAIDKGASLSDAQMITGGTLIDKDAVRLYQDSSTEDRAKLRAKMQVGGQGADVAAAQTAVKTMGEADTAAGKTNPALSLALQAATAKRYDIAWDAFSQDPGGALASLITQSLPASGGAVVGGIAAGPIGIGLGSAGGEALSNLSGIVQSTAAKYGYDVSTPEGLIAFFDDKDAWAEAQGQSQTRAAVIGVFDAVTGHVAGAVMGPAARNIASAPLKAVTHAAGSSAIEGIGGAAGEATAEVATGQPLDPGQILAEGVGEVVPGIAEAAAAGAHAGKFKAPVTEVDLEAMERTQQAYRAQKAREAADAVARAEAAAKTAAAGAERARAEAAARDARAKAEQEQRKSQGKAGPNYQDKTWRGKFSSTAREAGADGRYHTDENGFVVSDKGGPIHFADNKTAARWILDVAQKQSPDQIFERANHPGQAGTTVQVTGIREAETTPEGEAAGFASSNEEAKINSGQEAPNSAAGEAPLGGLPATAQAAAANAGAKNPESGGPFPGSKANPAEPETEADLHAATANAASSPVNDHPEPTDAQKAAGNYKKGHIKIQGLEIAIENPKGSVRSGTSPDGSKWESQLPVHYGYVKRTEGADGDQVDVFVGDNPKSEKVWVIDQLDPKTGEFDEHKAVMGVDSTMTALKAYTGSYSDNGARRIGAVTQMSVDEFKAWLKNGDTKKPAGNISTAQAKIKGTTAEVIDDAVPVEETPAASSAGAETTSQGKPEGFEGLESIPASQIGVDAKRFQFKEGGDEQGRLATLKGVKTWDKTKADIVSVWRDLSGKNLIGDGHQRLGLAHELEAGGHPPIDMLSRVYKESDGYKPADVMMIAAIKNIAQGTGTPMDAAKIFRRLGLGAGPLQNLPPRSALVQQGQALAKLGDEAFQLVVNGVVPANYAAVVGREIGGEKQQVAAMKILHKADPQSLQEADAIIQQIKAQGFEEKVNQGGLFGDEEIAESLVIERAKILSAALTELKRNRQLFNQLLKREDVARAAGNQLNTEANQQEKATHEQLLAIITKLANTKGPVSDALSAAARQLKAGKRIGAVAGDFLASVALQQSDEQRADRAGDGESATAAEQARKVDLGPVLPGFEPSTKEKLASKEREKKPEQKPMDFGLFDRQGHLQTDLEPGKGAEVIPPEPKKPEWSATRRMLEGTPGQPIDGRQDFAELRASFPATREGAMDAAKEWVVRRGKAHNVENMVVIDRDGNAFLAGTSNQEGQGAVKVADLQRLLSEDMGGVFHHNHPNSMGLSLADIRLTTANGLRRVVAYTHAGDVLIIERGPAIDKIIGQPHAPVLFANLHEQLHRNVLDQLIEAVKTDPNPNLDLYGLMESHATTLAMAKLGLIDYMFAGGRVAKVNEKSLQYADAAVRKYLDDQSRQKPFAGILRADDAGSTELLREQEAMGRVSEKPGRAAAERPGGDRSQEAGKPAAGREDAGRKVVEAPAFHGSPHAKFNKFSTEKIGTGEGNQSYGWGLYFAGRKAIAEYYRDALSKGLPDAQVKWKGKTFLDPNGRPLNIKKEFQSDVEKILKYLVNRNDMTVEQLLSKDKWKYGAFNTNHWTWSVTKPHVDNVLNNLKKAGATLGEVPTKKGSLYHVELQPEEHEYLDLDQKMDKQSPFVQERAAAMLKEIDESTKGDERVQDAIDEMLNTPNDGPENWTKLSGRGFYDALQKVTYRLFPDMPSDQATSKLLHEHGIRGNRYLDNKSRNASKRVEMARGYVARAEKDIADYQRWLTEAEARGADDAQIPEWKDLIKKGEERLAGEKKLLADTEGEETFSNYVIFDDQDVAITLAEASKPYFTASPNLNPQQAQQVQQGAVQIFDELNKPGVMGKVDRFFATYTRLVHDDQITGKRVQDIIEEKTGTKIPDIQNFYATEEVARSRGADQMQQLDRKIVRKLIKAIKASGESLHDLEKYAYALHAEERNISIAAINTAMPDGGAGVLTADAQAHLASLTAEQKRRMQPAIDLIRELREFDLSMRVNYGLMDAGEAMRLLTEWPNYVPLQGREDLEGDEDRVHGGEGYSVRGPEFQVAKGRWSQPTNILGHMLAQAQTSILRGQANWVGQSLARLAQAHPDDKFWEVDRVKYKRIIDKNTGLVRINYTAEQDPDHTIYYKVGGEPHRIWIQDRRWVSNLKKQRVNGIMQVLRLVRPFMHLLRLMIIAWNFDFLVSNLPRDIQTGMVQSLSYKVPKLRRRIVKNYMSSLMQGLLGAHGEDLGPWTKWMRRASAAGALSGNESASDVNAWRKNLAWETSRNPAVKAAKAAAFPIAKTLSGIERLNTGVEAAMRVATFRACVEGGLSDLQAASIAKNITVNFDRSGELGPYANALYLFFTATMGGGLTLVRAIKRRPGLIAAAGASLFLAGAAETLKFALQSGSDDDKDKKEAETYFALPDYAQERNIIYAQPKEDGPFKSVPLAYGLNVPYDAGKYAVMYALGKISGGEFFSKLFDSTMHSFSPLDVDRGWPAVLPSVGQPFGDVAQNESWSGKPINPDKHGKPIPDSENTYAGVPDAYKKFAKGLNEAAGGSDVESSGVFDISPGSMEYIIEQFTGGVGNMANRILRVREKIESGEEIEASDLPIARKYFVTSAKTVMREKFYEISNHLEDLDGQRDALRKKRREADDGDPKKAAQARIDAFELEHKDELGYLHEARRQRNKFDRLRKDAKKVDDDKSLTEAQKRKSKGVIFDQMNALALDMVRSYNRDVLVPLQSSRAWIKITPKGVELNR